MTNDRGREAPGRAMQVFSGPKENGWHFLTMMIYGSSKTVSAAYEILKSDGSAGLMYTGAASYDFEKKRELQPAYRKKKDGCRTISYVRIYRDIQCSRHTD